MASKAWGFVFGYFCINAAIWTLSALSIFTLTRAPVVDPNAIGNLFSLDIFTVITGAVGGAVIGILALMTKSYALSTGVLLLWIVGIILTPIRDVFVGLPVLLNTLLADIPAVASVISQVIVAFGALMLFIFVVEILAGREIWG